jgi:hypothetical protein
MLHRIVKAFLTVSICSIQRTTQMQGITFGRVSVFSQKPRFSGERGNNSGHLTDSSIESSPEISDAEGDIVQLNYPYAAVGALQERSQNLKLEIAQYRDYKKFATLSDKQRKQEEAKIQKLETERKVLKQAISAKQKFEVQTALYALEKS